jgi:hypothetical protein
VLVKVTYLDRSFVNRFEATDFCKQQTMEFVVPAVFFGSFSGMREIQFRDIVIVIVGGLQRNMHMPAPAVQPGARCVQDDGVQPGIQP